MRSARAQAMPAISSSAPIINESLEDELYVTIIATGFDEGSGGADRCRR